MIFPIGTGSVPAFRVTYHAPISGPSTCHPVRVYYDNDTHPALIQSRRVAILGFGAQGRAHARNLHDTGIEVTVGLRAGSPSLAVCDELGLRTAEVEDAVQDADLVMMLVPDQAQPAVYREQVAPKLRASGALAFAHGFSIQYKSIEPRPDIDIIMIAPLGIGDQVRETYVRGAGVPALIGVHQDASGEARELALAYAWANGHGRAGILETSFREETETDLFAEQAVLCGGLTALVRAGFETLTGAGYPAELAYFACLHELKLITDLMYARGIAGMRRSISATAEFGDYTRGPRVIGEPSRAEMRRILEEIQTGRFARELAEEFASGAHRITEERRAAETHPIEEVGGRLRAMMPWLRRSSR